MRIGSELDLPMARIQLSEFNHPGPTEYFFRQDHVYWIDMCLTPRRLNERARYQNHWVPHRFSPLGSVIALPPGEPLELHSSGGRRTSLICQLRTSELASLLPVSFEMTDRRLEACLDINSPEISGLLRRMARELRQREIGWGRLAEALVEQVAIELARYLLAVTDADESGGLAAWRLRVVDKRLAQPGPPPSLPELAQLCNMSVRHLTRAFRLTRGCTIGEFVNQGRIEAAKRRLATQESIKAIAASLGYSSHANFSTAFKHAAGVTPHEFRTRVLRGGERSPD